MSRLLFILIFGVVVVIVNNIQLRRIKKAESVQAANGIRIITLLFRGIWPIIGIVGYIYCFRFYLDSSDVDLIFDELLLVVILSISYFTMFPRHRKDKESLPISVETKDTYLSRHEDFVLYLRAFHNDKYIDENMTDVTVPYLFEGPKPDDQYVFESFCEQFFMDEINRFLPSSAIGMSSEMECPIGASRIYVDDISWQEDVLELMGRSTWIIVLLEDRESCLWELEQSLKMREKTIYIVDDLEIYSRIKNKKTLLSLPVIPECCLGHRHFFLRWMGNKYVVLPFENTIQDYRWFAHYLFGVLSETDISEMENNNYSDLKQNWVSDINSSTILKADKIEGMEESSEENEKESPSINNLDECIEKAHQGVAEAQYGLALRHFEGDGVEKDAKEAVKWLKKASDQGLAKAQNELGCSYYNGEGIEKDLVTAFALFTEAANKGNANAQANLGLCYYFGDGTYKDFAQATKWLKKAAIKGIDYAQYYLGLCYMDGIGVKKDIYEARKWFRQAADNGHAEASLLLSEEKRETKRNAWKNIILGIILLVGGLLFTVLTYNQAMESGGYFFIAWGAIIAGGIEIIRGLIDMI